MMQFVWPHQTKKPTGEYISRSPSQDLHMCHSPNSNIITLPPIRDSGSTDWTYLQLLHILTFSRVCVTVQCAVSSHARCTKLKIPHHDRPSFLKNFWYQDFRTKRLIKYLHGKHNCCGSQDPCMDPDSATYMDPKKITQKCWLTSESPGQAPNTEHKPWDPLVYSWTRKS